MSTLQFEGPLSLLIAKHESLKAVHSQMAIDFAKEIAESNVTDERQHYMHTTLANMEARIQKQAAFFDKWTMELSKEELHAFTGGYKDQAWTVGHPKFGRFSS